MIYDIRTQITYLTSKLFSHFGKLNSAPKTDTGTGSWKRSCDAGAQSLVLWVCYMIICEEQFRDQD